jgi:dTDP-4-dehydrorhamnose reductase
MPDVLITGSGMIATALAAAGPRYGWSVELHPQAQTDITDGAAVRSAVLAAQPNLIFHTAALTRVNYCQEHPAEALLVNRTGTMNVVQAAQETGAQVIYFSTDYIFNGRVGRPWVETDAPGPLNVYGESKLAGEEIIRAYPQGYVVRTSGVFGNSNDPGGERNFFRAITTKLCQTDEEIPVVADQMTTVTYAPHLAEMLFTLLSRELAPIVHLTSDGNGTWYDWARLATRQLGIDEARIAPISAAERNEPARRPTLAVLGSEVAGVPELRATCPAIDGLATYLSSLDMQPPVP